MNKRFYPKLALSNIKKNGKFYFPYMLTCVVTVAIFYIMASLTNNESLSTLPRFGALVNILRAGTVVIGIFAVLFLFYTNSFLMKRRKKELGLYHILGMEKRHVCRVLLWETIYVAVGTMLVGLVSGMVLDRLLQLLLCKMIHFSFQLNFFISLQGVAQTVVLFVGIFAAILISQFISIGKSNPIELLKGGSVGEKEPKAKWFMALLGLVCVGIGYRISFTTNNPLSAIQLFFVAILAVIVGTYLLFTAGSIVVLKLLKKNKKFYYQTSHFTAVSGMLYRMKQNAVGLANIAILSTMVLVILSATICLYAGAEDSIQKDHPYDMSADLIGDWNQLDEDAMMNEIHKIYETYGARSNQEVCYTYLNLAVEKKGNKFRRLSEANNPMMDDMAWIQVMTREGYETVSGESVEELDEDEILLFTDKDKLDTLRLYGEDFTCKAQMESYTGYDENISAMLDFYGVIVKDDAVLEKLKKKNPQDCYCSIGLDYQVSGTKKQAMEKDLKKVIRASAGESIEVYNVESQDEVREGFYSIYGGFLFLGVFLGILFLIATTLIIYYKQISEGYEDQSKFVIMEKVGMTRKEVKQSIRTQVLMVFFLPLAVACVHVMAAYPLVKRLLAMFMFQNNGLFIACIIGTICVFSILYAVVYLITSRIYDKIVATA